MESRLAVRYQQIADPTVVKLLEITNQPGIISFAGGIPAPETFPTELVADATRGTPLNLQYSSTQGLLELRELVSSKLSREWEREGKTSDVLITSGSQQALDLIGRTFVDQDDTVLVEDPTYFVALYAFGAYGANYRRVDWRKPQSIQGAKLAYMVPNYQNPTGETLTQVQRQVIATMLGEAGTLLVEDDPYGELYFGRRPPRPIASIAPKQTIYVTSFSKIMAPAFRLGVVVAEATVIEKLARVKTGMDLCTSAMTQGIALRVLQDPRYTEHLIKLRQYYGRKARVMLMALKQYMPKGVAWTHPQGGMFVWVTLPACVDTAQLHERALGEKVAFVPGYIFRSSKEKSSSLRLSFATASGEEIERGIEILASLVKQTLRGGERK